LQHLANILSTQIILSFSVFAVFCLPHIFTHSLLEAATRSMSWRV